MRVLKTLLGGFGDAPEGSILEIELKYWGFELKGCIDGELRFFSHVAYEDVELIGEEIGVALT